MHCGGYLGGKTEGPREQEHYFFEFHGSFWNVKMCVAKTHCTWHGSKTVIFQHIPESKGPVCRKSRVFAKRSPVLVWATNSEAKRSDGQLDAIMFWPSRAFNWWIRLAWVRCIMSPSAAVLMGFIDMTVTKAKVLNPNSIRLTLSSVGRLWKWVLFVSKAMILYKQSRVKSTFSSARPTVIKSRGSGVGFNKLADTYLTHNVWPSSQERVERHSVSVAFSVIWRLRSWHIKFPRAGSADGLRWGGRKGEIGGREGGGEEEWQYTPQTRTILDTPIQLFIAINTFAFLFKHQQVSIEVYLTAFLISWSHTRPTIQRYSWKVH